jgi:hypothetical protein
MSASFLAMRSGSVAIEDELALTPHPNPQVDRRAIEDDQLYRTAQDPRGG